MGEFASARESLHGDPEWQIPSKFSRGSLLTAEYLGDIDLEQGNAKAALARFVPALTQALALVPRGDVVAELRRRIAECHLLLGDPAQSLAEATEAIALCREIHERYDEAATHRVIALAHAALGHHGEAKKAFDAGFAEYDEIETPYEWGKLWLAYGDWLSADSSESYRSLSGAREAYVAAIDHFERIGAEFRLAQARTRLASLDETMRLEGATYAPTHGKVRPARRPRHSAEVLRRSQWALDTFGIVTRSAPLLDMLHELGRVAVSDLPVLVLGESGTGKELVAKGVHLLSGRTGEFVAINCSAVPEAMLEGEFFGYMKGSFTNAVADKPGLFEVAHEGTVFLDEIGEMSPDLQSKLLRFLETGTLRRVGATRDQRVDTRIIAATNRDRAALQSGSTFRSDLYYRLAHAVYELPPLRARGDDVELLLEHFLGAFNRIAGKHARFGDAALARMLQFAWPGNVRELQAVVRKLVVAAGHDTVFTPRDLPLLEGADTRKDFIGETLANEKKRIVAALEQSHWVKTDAANILRISRTTLLSKMKRMGIEG
jgi:DNA-binding NtrC family response regulator